MDLASQADIGTNHLKLNSLLVLDCPTITKDHSCVPGDLGFLHEGELYITGRIKNLIISDGKNHYPHDIERTVEGSHPAIRPTGCAVFSINNSGAEDIIVIAEIEYKPVVNSEEVIKAIRQAVATHHDFMSMISG